MKPQNFVAKNQGINKSSVHIDKKKQQKTPRKLKYNNFDKE